MEDISQFSSRYSSHLLVRKWHVAVGPGSADLSWTATRRDTEARR
jgi:hypothetical protein